jgi:hypothetical protein
MRGSGLVFAFATLTAVPALAADPATIDWSKVPAVTVTLFYPGQSSYEWLRTSSHPGAQPVSQGMLGDKIVTARSSQYRSKARTARWI